tara:strand:+ start:2823 stop:3194 length:372 start_codon:yes stop_codon:yes gene_type:complete
MIFWILQRIIVSLILILCAHYIYIFLKTNLTTPKTRDLVNHPREKYKEMYEKINNVNDSTDTKTTDTQMKNELKNYLKDLKNTSSSNDNTNGSDNSSSQKNTSGIKDFSQTSMGKFDTTYSAY